MIETVKALIEEPEKLRKYFVFLIKFILSAIFTSVLYQKMFGEYVLLDFSSNIIWYEIYHFVISGKILAITLLYLASKLLLFGLIAKVPASLLRHLVNSATKNEARFKDSLLIRIALESLGVINFDKKNNKGTLGKNYEEFHEVVSIYQNKEVKKEIHNLKNSLMNEILYTFFVFTLLYFTVLDSIHVQYLTVLVITGLTLSCCSFYALTVIIKFFDLNAAEILYGLNGYKLDKLVTDFLDEHSIYIVKEQSTQKKKRIQYNDISYDIWLYYGKQRIVSQVVTPLLTTAVNSDVAATILITDTPVSKTARKLLEENEKVKIIYAKTDKCLNRELKKYFLEK